jgi:tetratricopeptide (TPR) repeat protein
MPPSGFSPEFDPLPAVFLMENHDEAYHTWRKAGYRDKILVHIDAHDDLWQAPGPGEINIANFISLGLKDNLIKQVFWVVPDQTWASRRCIKQVHRRLVKVLKSYPEHSAINRIESGQISATVLGKPLQVCTLDNLPRITEPVLLDIDVDFLIIRQACGLSNTPEVLPWGWPAELLERLLAVHLQADLVTIAYSVEGGYTPLPWKYLGDELALRLGNLRQNNGGIRGMELLRAAALATHRGDFATGEEHYLAAKELLPDSAAPGYHLAQLYLSMGKKDQAAASYREAMLLDPSYRTAYNSFGLWYYAARLLAPAAAEYRRTLSLDPEDAYAHLGLGRVAAKQKRWGEAESWLKKALVIDPNLVDAYRALGKIHAKRGCLEEAIAAYERSLILALRGHNPLTGAIATDFQGLLDPAHFRIHGRLAQLYSLKGETVRAITSYRMSIAKGGDGVAPRVHLACLYLKQRQWRLAFREAWQAVKAAPAELTFGWQHLRKVFRRLRYRLDWFITNRF